MNRIVERQLPDGRVRKLSPFHFSLEGLKTDILCREEEDYDIMVKYLAICARRKNVILVIYAAVSNHCHAVILAMTQVDADRFAQEVKRSFSQWFFYKYQSRHILKGLDAKSILLDNDHYLRNALAYVPRNALDNGYAVQDYPWSGFRAMFSGEKPIGRRVSLLTKRQREGLMHTGDSLKDVGWMLDEKGALIPWTICDCAYLEQAFNHDHAFFLRVIGGVNSGEMRQKLVDGPRQFLPDTEFRHLCDDLSHRWFDRNLEELPLVRRLRLVSYLYRTQRTSVPQLSRMLHLDRETVSKALGKVPGVNGEG